ncbi:MAG: hypothetical protein KDD62_13215 [Bdellovibrionales bacterium]|nr:hypothetical protein [Bdellovibrionales bacterium]
MTSATFFTIAAMVVLALGLLSLGMPLYLAREQLSFLQYASMPLGAFVPWVLGFIVIMIMSVFVAASRQQGFGYTGVFMLLGAAILPLVACWASAFFWLDVEGLYERFLIGMKLATPFTVLALLFVAYLGFWPTPNA